MVVWRQKIVIVTPRKLLLDIPPGLILYCDGIVHRAVFLIYHSTAQQSQTSSSSSSTTGSTTTSSFTSSTSSTSSTSTTSSSTSSTTSSVPTVVPGCPDVNGTTVSVTYSDSAESFLKFCQRDLQSILDDSVDIRSLVVTGLDECLSNCVAFNVAAISTGIVGRCRGVTYNEYIPSFTYNNHRCYLKNGTNMVFMQQEPANIMASALLVGGL